MPAPHTISQPYDAATVSSAYRSALEVIGAVEPTIAGAIRSELVDQRESLKLIASENYASPAVLLTMGTWLSDKYAEGTIGHRFYAACQNIDTVEQAAADHAKALFGAPHAYVQPHSGIDANLVAFWAILAQRIESPALARAGAKHVNDLTAEDWETLRKQLGNQRALGMSLDAGGHLTHGFRPNISGKMFEQSSYGTDPETGLLDYGALRDTARGFDADDFDRVAELMVDVLSATSPAAAPSGGVSKAKYAIAGGLADKTRAAAQELLAANPLYPGLDLG